MDDKSSIIKSSLPIIFLLFFSLIIVAAFTAAIIWLPDSQNDDSSNNETNINEETNVNESSIKELRVEISEEGTGQVVESGDLIQVHYTGTFEDGSVFDSSEGSEPIEFNVDRGNVIQGWDQGLLGLKEGTKATLYIPSDLAYGPAGRGSIPANAALIFDIEVVKVTK